MVNGLNLEITIFVTTAIISTSITIATVIISSYFTRKNQKQLILIENITKRRIHWIDSLRDELSDFLKHVRIYLLHRTIRNLSESASDRSWTSLSEVSRLASQIVLRLNINDDTKLKEKIEKLRTDIFYKDNFSSKELEFINNEIIKQAQILMKKEWEKIKSEAKTFKIN